MSGTFDVFVRDIQRLNKRMQKDLYILPYVYCMSIVELQKFIFLGEILSLYVLQS